MQKIAWVALRQLEAIRDSVATTLIRSAVCDTHQIAEEILPEWVTAQGVMPFYYRHMPEDRLEFNMRGTIQSRVEAHGVDHLLSTMAGTRSRFDESDVGFERSSAGWSRHPNFITTSALLRVLGAMEQFELDVLKALLYYRPHGLATGPKAPQVDASLEVVNESPHDGMYTMPALWSWLRKPAENNVERRKIFMNVFGIDCFPPFESGKRTTAYYSEIYEKRNMVAHGRKFVDFSLAEYCMAEAFVLITIRHISEICETKYGLRI